MKEQATRLWGWIRQYREWSFIILIVLLVGMGFGTVWTVNLVRFGLPPPTGQDCGRLPPGALKPPTRADAELQPLACFWHAYQTCQAATISQTYYGISYRFGSDWSTAILTTELRGNRCVMYGQEEVHLGLSTTTTIFLCTQLSKVGDTLQVTGCDGIAPFALAPLAVPQDSFSCGVVGAGPVSVYNTPQEMESCFFTAYQQCLGYKMGYKTEIEGFQVERIFYIDNHCRLAYQLLSEKGTCASLAMRADGLHFSQCGTDGDYFVPSNPPSTSS